MQYCYLVWYFSIDEDVVFPDYDFSRIGLAGHVLRSDVDGGREYEAVAAGYGVNAGIGRLFRVNETFNPFVELTLGYTHFNTSQTKQAGILSIVLPGTPDKFYSNVDMNALAASLLVAN